MDNEEVDFLVVGAGFSGLMATLLLSKAGKSVQLVEARDRIGGRAMTASKSWEPTAAQAAIGAADCDLGPSWVWPDQPLVLNTIKELRLEVYSQFDQGRVSFQHPDGKVESFAETTPMAGALRIQGGAQNLAHRISQQIDRASLNLKHRVVDAIIQDDGIKVTCETAQGKRQWQAQKLVVAVPPRLASEIGFEPQVPDDVVDQLQGTPTWMAGHAKFFAVYEQPFWRDQGLCGSAFSRRGPLTEIHDASPHPGKVGALFGFLGLDPATRVQWGREKIVAEAIAQLKQIFGDQAAAPVQTHYTDWSLEPCTAASADRVPQTRHPQYGLRLDVGDLWRDKLFFIASETSFLGGGLIAGAFQAAHDFACSVMQAENTSSDDDGSHFASMGWDWLDPNCK